MDMVTKVSTFWTALMDVYRDEEKRSLSLFPKLELGDDFTEDLTAMLLAMRVLTGKASGNSWDILEFTHVLNTLAVQYLLDGKEDEANDN